MIQLHVTVWKDDDGNDRFIVMAEQPPARGLVDVTDQYELAAVATPEGRPGFAVFRRQ